MKKKSDPAIDPRESWVSNRRKLFSRSNLQLITITRTIVHKVSISGQTNCRSAHVYIYILHTQKSGKKIVAIQTIVVCIALTTSQEEDEKRKEIEKKWNRYNMCPCTFSCTRYDLWFNILLVRKRENGINFLLLFSYRSIISSSYESLPLLLCRRRRRRRRRRCCHHRSRRHYECKVYGNE